MTARRRAWSPGLLARRRHDRSPTRSVRSGGDAARDALDAARDGDAHGGRQPASAAPRDFDQAAARSTVR